MRTVRLGQFNLLNSLQSEERFGAIAEAVRESGIDILAVQELIDVELFTRLMDEIGLTHRKLTRYRVPGKDDYSGVYSRYPLSDSELDEAMAEHSITLARVSTPQGDIALFSAHFPWGSHSEPARTRTAEAVEAAAAKLPSEELLSTVLSGDLNADPEARSIRFLSGKEVSLDGERGALWTDAWAVAGSEENRITSDHSSNEFGKRTARGVGIALTEFLPPRRIDYIFTRGWTYGRIGGAVDFGRITHSSGVELSDHEGIWADILVEL